jgi:hypothetical protein
MCQKAKLKTPRAGTDLWVCRVSPPLPIGQKDPVFRSGPRTSLFCFMIKRSVIEMIAKQAHVVIKVPREFSTRYFQDSLTVPLSIFMGAHTNGKR